MNCKVCKGACCESFSMEVEMRPSNKDGQRWLELHAIKVEEQLIINRLTFECRCTKLTSEGRCSIWEDRPMICELYIAGGRQCLETVKARRTPEEYSKIRGEDDPEFWDDLLY